MPKKQVKTITKEDWLPDVRKKKDRAYLNVLKKRLEKAPKFKAYSGPPNKDKKAIKDSLKYLKPLPEEPKKLSEAGSGKLRVYLTVLLFMQYTPSKEEVLDGFRIFTKYFPWQRDFEAATPGGFYFFARPVSRNEKKFDEFLKINVDGFFGLRTSYKDNPPDQQVFNFYGTPTHNGQAMGGFMEVLLPADSDSEKVFQMTRELIEAASFSHGFAGFVAPPSQANYREEIKDFYDWSRRYWALELSDLNEFWMGAKDGPITNSWLTFLNQQSVKLLKKYQGDSILDFKDKKIKITETKQGALIKVGNMPDLGDIGKAFPTAYAKVYHHLKPLFSPIRKAVRMMDEMGATQTWIHRYEDPAKFAMAPSDLVDGIKEAFDKSNEGEIIENIKKLRSYNQAGQKSIQEALSGVAYSFLQKKETLKALKEVMHFLCDYQKPMMNDLTNLLYVQVMTDDLNLKKDHLEKIKTYAPKNPIIYNNLIYFYLLKKEIVLATEVLESGIKHIDFNTYKKIKEGDSFKPLWESRKALEALGKIQKRVDPQSSGSIAKRNDLLEEKIKENPQDKLAHLEYAKWLKTENDLRGDLILTQIEAEEEAPKQRKKKIEAQKKWKEYVFQRIIHHFPLLEQKIIKEKELVEFHWGLIKTFSLHQYYDQQIPEALKLLNSPECDFLEKIYLSRIQLNDLKRIGQLTGLRSLQIHFSDHETLDLAELKALKNLEFLMLKGSKVKNFEAIGELKNLKELTLAMTDINDIGFISELKELQLIGLQQTQVTDITPLLKLPKLWEVWLNGLILSKKQTDTLDQWIHDGKRPKPDFGVCSFPIIYGLN